MWNFSIKFDQSLSMGSIQILALRVITVTLTIITQYLCIAFLQFDFYNFCQMFSHMWIVLQFTENSTINRVQSRIHTHSSTSSQPSVASTVKASGKSLHLPGWWGQIVCRRWLQLWAQGVGKGVQQRLKWYRYLPSDEFLGSMHYLYL